MYQSDSLHTPRIEILHQNFTIEISLIFSYFHLQKLNKRKAQSHIKSACFLYDFWPFLTESLTMQGHCLPYQNSQHIHLQEHYNHQQV